MNFQQNLKSGKFVVTLELCPSKGVDVSKQILAANKLKNRIDAFNVTDNQRAVMRLSSLALSTILVENEIEPIMQITCRDRNRLAIQSDLLGAYALGIRNILVITGDHISQGDHNFAKQVFDIDSVQLLGIIQNLNKGLNSQDENLNSKPKFYYGGVFNPNTTLIEPQIIKIKKKIDKGAQFFQTQVIYNINKFISFIQKFKEFGINKESIKILVGVLPLKSAKTAKYMNENVPGVSIPKTIIKRLEISLDPKKEGVRIVKELIQELKPYCDGIHLMTMGKYDDVEELLDMIGL